MSVVVNGTADWALCTSALVETWTEDKCVAWTALSECTHSCDDLALGVEFLVRNPPLDDCLAGCLTTYKDALFCFGGEAEPSDLCTAAFDEAGVCAADDSPCATVEAFQQQMVWTLLLLLLGQAALRFHARGDSGEGKRLHVGGLEDLTRRESVRAQLQFSPAGAAVDAAMAAVCAWSCLNFVVAAYLTDYPAWLQGIDVSLSLCVGVDYALRLYAAPDRPRAMLALPRLLDVLTVVPFLTMSVVRGQFTGFPFLRYFRLSAHLERILAFLGHESALFGFASALVGLVFCFSCAIMVAEGVGNPPSLSYSGRWGGGARELRFHDAVYAVAATITTVGYGDEVPASAAGRACMVALIVCALVVLPRYARVLVQYDQRFGGVGVGGGSSGGGQFRHEPGEPQHTVCVGRFASVDRVHALVQATQQLPGRLVLLSAEPASKALDNYLCQNSEAKRRAVFLTGGAADCARRAGVAHARAVVLFAEGSDEVSEALALRALKLEAPVYVSFAGLKTRQKLRMMGNFAPARLVCRDELSMALMGKAARCPGFAALTVALLQQTYVVPLAVDMRTLSFHEAAAALYEACGVLLVGVRQAMTGAVYLNPGFDVHISANDEGFVVAASSEVAGRVSEWSAASAAVEPEVEDQDQDRPVWRRSERTAMSASALVDAGPAARRIVVGAAAAPEKDKGKTKDKHTFYKVHRDSQAQSLRDVRTELKTLITHLDELSGHTDTNRLAGRSLARPTPWREPTWMRGESSARLSDRDKVEMIESWELMANQWIGMAAHCVQADALASGELPDGLGDHVVVCGLPADFVAFLEPLRHMDLQALRPVVFVAPLPPDARQWERAVQLEDVYYLKGDADDEGVLRRAGVHAAAAVVVLAPDGDGDGGGDGLAADAVAVLSYHAVLRVLPRRRWHHVSVQLLRMLNAKFLTLDRVVVSSSAKESQGAGEEAVVTEEAEEEEEEEEEKEDHDQLGYAAEARLVARQAATRAAARLSAAARVPRERLREAGARAAAWVAEQRQSSTPQVVETALPVFTTADLERVVVRAGANEHVCTLLGLFADPDTQCGLAPVPEDVIGRTCGEVALALMNEGVLLLAACFVGDDGVRRMVPHPPAGRPLGVRDGLMLLRCPHMPEEFGLATGAGRASRRSSAVGGGGGPRKGSTMPGGRRRSSAVGGRRKSSVAGGGRRRGSRIVTNAFM